MAFCMAGLWMFASPAVGAPLKASNNPGTELASNRCSSGATATNVGGIAVGCGARAESGTIAILNRNNPFERRTDTIPSSITRGGLLEAQSIAIGEAASAGKSAIAVGGRSNAVDELATAMGVWARAQGKSSIAIGPRTLATGNTSLALGRQSVANADFAQAIGNVAAATGVSALAVGHSATATGPRSIAIGGADTGLESVGGQGGVTYQENSATKATGIGSVALGGGAIATTDRALALGDWAQATRAGSVALGSGSNTDVVATAISSATVGGVPYTGFAGVVTDPNKLVSVGFRAGERQIKNVGSGEISATSTDAVNGSQLYAVAMAARQGGSISFSGDVNGAGSSAANDKKVNISSGENLNITGGVTAPNSLVNDQIGVVADPSGKTLNVRLRKDLNLGGDGSLQFGANGPKLNGAGLNMNNKKVTGLAPGTTDTDAVNVSQLNGVKATADNAVTRASNAVTEASKGWNLQANGDAASKVAPGNTVQFIDGTNIDITRRGNNVTVATSPDLTANSLSINNGGPVLNANGIAMGNKKISGLANGNAPADAVNFSQLNGVKSTADNALTQAGNALTQAGNAVTEASKGWNLQANGDAASKVAPGNTVQFIDGTNIDITRQGNAVTIATSPQLAADGLTINNGGPVLNANGIAMGNKKISGLANGNAPADAVNFSQLNGVKSTADNALTQAGNALTQAGNAVTEASKGWNLQANGDAASKVAPGNTVQFIDGTNIDITRQGNDVTIATSPQLTADSLIINNGGPVLNATGIVMGGKKITGLADGTAPTDAVSFSQLNGVKSEAAKALTQADNALAQAGFAVIEASKGWNLQANGDAASKVAPGDTLQFLDGNNINITRNGNDLAFATSADLIADSLTINNGGPVLNASGIELTGKKITGLADGTAPTDAVSFSQLGDVKTLAENAMNEASKGFNLQANDDSASKVAPGDTVQFIDGTNIDITRVGNGITIATAADLTADSLTINNGGPVISSVGVDLKDKKLTNIAAGTLSAGSKDGVNGSQLFAVGNSTAAAFGGDSVFDPATGVVTPSLKVGDKNFTNVNAALGDLNDTLASTTAEASKGWNLQANGDTASKVAPGDTVQFIDGNNIDITRNGNDITIATAGDLTADSLTFNNGGPVLSSAGIDLNDKKLTNMEAGTLSIDSKDGVNASQLFAVGNSTAAAFGGDSTFDPATGVVTPSLKVGDKNFTNVNDALSDLNTTLASTTAEASKGWNLQANGDAASKVASGDTVQFIDGTNINVTRNGNDITVATAADLAVDSLTINNGGPVLGSTGIDLKDKKLTNVAAGTLSADGKDAVNASQLFTVGNSTAAAFGGDSTFDPATGVVTPSLKVGDKNFTNVNAALGDLNDTLASTTAEASKGWNLQANGDDASKVAPGDTVQFIDGTNINITRAGNDITIATAKDLTADSLTVNNGGPVLSSAGVDLKEKKLTNMAGGTLSTDSKDGVNAGQLFAVGNSTAAAFGGGSTFDPATGVVTPSLKVGDRNFTNVNDALGDLNDTLASTTTEASKGWNLKLNDEASSKVAPGDTVKLANGNNIALTKDGDAISIGTVPNLKADSLTINNGGPVFNVDGISMNEKKITNVTAGTLSADGKDAVNASQLFAVGNSTAAAFGGDSTFDPATGVVTPSLKVGDKNFTNVNAALGNLNDTLASTTAEASKGWNLQANGDTASKVGPGDTVQLLDGTNINVTRNGNDITVATTLDLTADSLSIDNGGPVLGSTGIDLNDKKLTNVAAGALSADSKDGVNASQLFAVGNSTAAAFGGDSTFDPATGMVTPSLKVGDKNFTNVNAALGDLNDTLASTATEASKGWNLQANGDDASKVAPGDTVQFIDGSNINVTRNGNDITVATTPDLTADSLSIANGGPVINVDGINMNNKKLANVAAGALSADSKDGVNGSQLFAVGNSTAAAFGGDSTFDPATGVVTPSLKVGDKNFNNVNAALGDLNDTLASTTAEAAKGWNLQANGDGISKVAPGDTVQFVDGANIDITRNGSELTFATSPNLTADSLTINNGGPTINSTGIDMSGKQLTNMGAGTLSADSKDGVNAGQLFAVGNSTAAAFGGGSTFDPATGVVTPSLKVGDRNFTTVNDALGDLNTTLASTTAEANKGWNLQLNDEASSKVAPGDTVKVANGSNIAITKDGDAISIGTVPNLTADSLTFNNGGPVLSSAGIDLKDKKLTNVAAGTLSADSKDGVNASQLFAMGNSTAAAFGGDSAFDPVTGVVTPSLKVGDKSFTDVNAALGDLNDTLSSTTAEAAKGWNLQANGDTATKVAPGDTVQLLDGSNINVSRNGNDITIATAADLTADSLTINNGGPVLGSTGIDLKDKKLTNMAAGSLSEDSKDGVNGSQLFAVGNSTAAAFGGDSTFDPATGVVTPSLKVGDKNFTNVNAALGDLNTALASTTAEANKGWNLQTNGDTASKVAPGDTVQFIDGTNINVTRNGNDLTIATVADLNADSLTINNGGPVLGSTGIDLKDKKLTNVAAGALSADSNDGVNGSQLFAVGNSTAAAFGGDSTFDPATGVVNPSLKVGDKNFTNVNAALGDLNDTLASTTAEAAKGWNLQANGDTASKVAPGDTVQFIDGANIKVTRNGNNITIATAADLTADSLSIANGGPVFNVDGINMNDKKLTNVQAGTLSADGKDAVNASQLFAVGNSTAAALGGDSAFDPATGVVTPSLKVGDKNFTTVNDALGDLNTTLASTTAEANKGWNLQANGDTASKVAPGDTVQFIDGTNIDITRDGNNITIATGADLTADSLTIDNGGPVLNSAGIDLKDKKLTNVAAGTLSADGKDAVNASQLFAVGNSTAAAFGGDSVFDPATGVVTPSIKVGEKNFTNVNDALGDLNTTLASTTAEAAKGWNLQTNGDAASKVALGDTVQFLDGNNIDITRNGNDITIATAADLTADSLTFNNGGPVLSSAGIDLKDKKLTNVAAGTLSADSKDGVNASQLFAAGKSTATAFGGDSTFDPETGEVKAGLKVGDQLFTSVNGALDAINNNVGTIARRGWDIAGSDGIVASVATGGQVRFVAGNEHTKVGVTQDNGVSTVSVSAAGSPLQYTQTNQANGKNDPVADPFGKTNSVTLVGQDAAAPVSLNNVAKATLSADSLQAVNGQQLYGLGQSIASTLGGDTRFNAETGQLDTTIRVGNNSYHNVADALSSIGEVADRGWQLQLNNDAPQKVGVGSTVGFNQGSNIQLMRDGNQITVATTPNVTFESVKADRVEGDMISAKSYLGVVDGPALTQSGIDAAGTPITNLKPGEIAEGSTDAVTGGQLHSLAGGTAAALNRLQGNLDRVAKDANAGSATAGAMANLPQAYLPGKSMFALATARYVGQQGFAAGLSKVSENGNWIIKGSVSGNTRGKTMVGAGIGYQW